MKPVLAALLVVFVAAAQEPRLHRGAGYRGAAAFPELPTITVVYPAGPSEPVDRNRRSAEARARWLTATYRSRVEVVADDRLTEAQRAGNLLILGWSNRAWEALGAARPFERNPGGLRFLGIAEEDPDVDLLLYHRNPVDWSSFILFWSRIDPGRDRYLVMPRVGSDWAMYSDYLVIRQGMFKPAREWPPARDPMAEADHTVAAAARLRALRTVESPTYKIAYEPGLSDAEAREILDIRTAALASAAAALGALPEGFRVTMQVFDTAESKKSATGVGDPAHSLPASRAIYAIRPYARSASPHEEVHVLAEQRYGTCVSSGLYEGLAVAVEGTYRGDSLEWHAAKLRKDGRLPSLSDVLDEHTVRMLPEDRGLLGAGIFLYWLRRSEGPDAVKKIYALPEVTLATVAKALGTDAPALEAAFGAWVDRQVTARRADLEFDAAEAEAQRLQRAGDWPGMAASLRKALASRPGDPQTLFNLASAEMRAGALPEAEASLKKLLGMPLSGEQSRFRIFGHYQLGRVYDLAGKRESALTEYRRALELPDEHGAHELARQRLASPATPEHLE